MPVTLVCLGTGRLRAHPFPSLILRVPRVVVETIDGPSFELLGLGGSWRCFLIRIPLTGDESWPVRRGKMSGEFSEGTDRDCVRTSHGETLWLIVVGAEIQVGGWFRCTHRPYKTKGFTP